MPQTKNLAITGSAGKKMATDIFCASTGGKKPVVIYAHGFNGFKDWGNFDLVAQVFAASGFVLVKFNFSHNGTTLEEPEVFADLEAFGNNNYSRQLEDLQQVVNWVADPANPYAEHIDTDNISLIGHSMGGGIAVLYAASDARIKKLVTWAAISVCKTPWTNWPDSRLQEWKASGVQYYTNTRTNQQLPLYYQLYLDYENNKEKLDIQKAIRSLTIPVLIIHGTNDLSVPVETAYQLKEWQPAATLFTLETNHVFDRQHPWILTRLPEAMKQVLEQTVQFLK